MHAPLVPAEGQQARDDPGALIVPVLYGVYNTTLQVLYDSKNKTKYHVIHTGRLAPTQQKSNQVGAGDRTGRDNDAECRYDRKCIRLCTVPVFGIHYRRILGTGLIGTFLKGCDFNIVFILSILTPYSSNPTVFLDLHK